MKYDVFISYSRKDRDVADKIYDCLTRAGFNCFIDRKGISGGADFPVVLASAIMESRLLLFLASEHSYTSDYTRKELTFANNEQGSGFIFPLIIDNSTLPTRLKFLFSDINWRTVSKDYTIEKDLVDDVRVRLDTPGAGISISHQENKSNRKFTFFTLTMVVVALITVLLLVFSKARDRQFEKEANADVRLAREYVQSALSSIARVDSLRAENLSLRTVSQEIAALTEAEDYLDYADSLKVLYRDGRASYAYLFSQIYTDQLHGEIQARRDSMFKVWNKYALSNYEYYLNYPDSTNLIIAIRYTNIALQIHPEDEDLIGIFDILNYGK